ncbi:TPA: hypothetical protein ACOAXM_003609 [Vibrio cholerae]
MPRHYEIDSAWRASIQREPNGRQTVTTENFVSQLALINFHWSCRQANQWIETYVTVFKGEHEKPRGSHRMMPSTGVKITTIIS